MEMEFSSMVNNSGTFLCSLSQVCILIPTESMCLENLMNLQKIPRKRFDKIKINKQPVYNYYKSRILLIIWENHESTVE